MAKTEKQSNLNRPEAFGCIKPNPVFCKKCRLSHGKPPFADQPEKPYCQAYTRENGVQKPNSVLFDGEQCAYFEEIQ